MDESKISTRYSKAFIEIAIEKNLLDEAFKDAMFIFNACLSEEFKLVLISPVILKSVKQKIFYELFKEKVNPLTISFLDLILKNNREAHLQWILRRFIDDYKNAKGIKTALLSTVNKIDDGHRKKLIESIKKIYQLEIELHEKIDHSIIGGFVLTIDDTQYDASVVSKLKNIKTDFINASFDN